jgi:hypothetical protein
MKYLIVLFVAFSFFTGSGHAAVPAAVRIEKTPVHHFYAYDFTDYVETRHPVKLPAHGLSGAQIEIEAGKAGWSAFSGYFGIEGATATVLQECLGAAFLSNINSVCGEIGGIMVVVQLMMDLAQKDYLMAGLNFTKGSLYYSLGKWGSKAMKVGAAGAAAIEWYITTLAGIVNRKHDDFYYEALKWYFYNGDGNLSLETWKQKFMSATIETPEDILKIVDDHVETFWISDNMYNAISDAKTGWGLVGEDPFRFQLKKKHFKEYATAIYVLPYIKPLLHRLAEEETDRAAQRVADQLNKINDDLNAVYTIKGIVKGPAARIRDLKVSIPDFLETRTDAKGRFKFQFSLYALIRAHMMHPGLSGITVEVRHPSDPAFEPMVKRGKIREKYRQTKEIRLTYQLPDSGGLKIVATAFRDPMRLYPEISGTIEMDLSIPQKTADIAVNLTKRLRVDIAEKQGRSADIENNTRHLFIDSIWTDKTGRARQLSIAPTRQMKRSGTSNRVMMVQEIDWKEMRAKGYYYSAFPHSFGKFPKSLTIEWEGTISNQ